MRSLKELLVGTAGFTRLARSLADEVLSANIDGSDHGLAIRDTTRLHLVRCRGVDGRPMLQFELTADDSTVQFGDKDARAIFGALYGALSADFDEPLDDGADKPNTAAADLATALDLLRTAQGMMGEPSEIEGSQEWFEAADKLLGRYPAPPVTA